MKIHCNFLKFSLVILLATMTISCQYVQEKQTNFPKPKNGNTFVIAHQGAHLGRIPPNSMAAYQKAIDLGCDYIEIDTRLTKDGVVVSIHNETVDTYVEGKTGKVKDFTLTELKAFDIGTKYGKEWEGTQIPTLEEILELCKGKIDIYIDLKESVVPEIITLLKKYNMESNAVWYIPGGRINDIKQVTQLCPECTPMPNPGDEENITNMIKEVHPIVIATGVGELTENFVKISHKNNVKVFADDRKGTVVEWKQMIAWKTDAIQTNQPKKLIEYLRNNKN